MKISAKDYLLKTALKSAVAVFPKFSNKNLVKLANFSEKITKDDFGKKVVRFAKKRFEENHPAVQLVKRAFNRLNRKSRAKVVDNLLVRASLLGVPYRNEIQKKTGARVPYTLVIDVTMKCNLKCAGCWAGKYAREEDMSFELLDKIVKEGKELGIYFYTITGGEPFVRQDLFKLFNKHSDAYFMIFTNGTFIDKPMAKRIAKAGNIAACISIEGFEKETDARRGQGTFKKIMEAMDNLREEGVLFGFSATPTRQNSEAMLSDEFIDVLIAKGCLIGWYFTYIPIGMAPDIALMQTPEQRDKFRKRVHELRDKKAIFFGDFWNDGPYTNGCIAGGRDYIHITNRGDVEPCVFAHFAVDNIKDKSLLEAFSSDFFKEIRKRQPFDKNCLTPCMIIDNPQILRDIVKKTNAHPTHEGADSIIKDKKIIEHLDKYSKEYHKIADPIWEKEYKHYREDLKKLLEKP